MKYISIILTAIILSGNLLAQPRLGIGTKTPHPSAVLDLTSTNRGLLPPRMTTAQRNAIANRPSGLLVYDITLNSLFHFNGSAWANVEGYDGAGAPPKVAFFIAGVDDNHLIVPHNSARRVQYNGVRYDFTQSYTPIGDINSWDPATSSTFLIPVTGVYHLDVRLSIINDDGIDLSKTSAALTLYRNRNGIATVIATNRAGEKNYHYLTPEIYFKISRDFSLLAGDRIYVQIHQSNFDEKEPFEITTVNSNSYFSGHFVTPL
jgi:hypothetical protein